MKLGLYGELHYLPEGTRPIPTEQRVEALPSDMGYVIGAQLGGWLRPYTFVNLFFRYATGLGVYGDLTLPQMTQPARSFSHARELVGALSLNYEFSRIGIMGGAYVRGFRDPDAQELNPRDYVEGAVALRPHLYLLKWLHLATELSYQQRNYGGFDAYLDRRLTPKVFRFSVLPVISPTGKGTYARPMLYAVYTVSVLNQDARDALFEPSDVRYGAAPTGNQTVHYIGLGAEWWFQSSYR
jgi:maltoporin